MTPKAAAPDGPRITSIINRVPPARMGVAVVEDLVNVIVSGELKPGDSLPPEGPLSAQFGVSRTVIRESMKRVEEKGLVTVAQGRGTQVQPTSSWNILDRVVLTALINNDDSLGVLDELSVVRARLEGVMAGTTAVARSQSQLEALREHLETMRASLDDSQAYRTADVFFHEAVMEFSGNRLAESIARILFERALESTRYHGVDPVRNFEMTLEEHQAVFDAIAGQQADAAERLMNAHIIDSWQRRRLPTHRQRRGE